MPLQFVTMGGACTICLLGGFAVRVAGRPVPASAWRRRRGAELIKLLALAPGHSLHREQVMETLWPELTSDAAGANLRKAIHYLRRALGTPEPVVTEAGIVALCPDWSVTTDVEEFEAAARRRCAAGRRRARPRLPATGASFSRMTATRPGHPRPASGCACATSSC